jgi:hypothetical protein
MLPVIDAFIKLLTSRTADMDMIDKAIDNLHQSDEELEWRLQRLRDQVGIYQREDDDTSPHDGQPHV